MLILEKLWKGDVAPGERCHISKGEYSKSYAAMVDSEEYLRKHLTGEDLQQFQQFWDAELNLSRLSDFNSFAEGFRLGALLMLDVLGCGEAPKDGSS